MTIDVSSRLGPESGMRSAVGIGDGAHRPSRRHVGSVVSDDALRQYLIEIGRVPLLTRADEMHLGREIERGREASCALAEGGDRSTTEVMGLEAAARVGARARDRLIEANLRLVVSVARRYLGSGLGLTDLIQEGNLGLIRAADGFDWRRGFKFSTYASWWIRQSITRGIANTGRAVRLPVHIEDLVHQLRRTRSMLEVSLERAPTVTEIAASAALPVHQVGELFEAAREPRSFSEPISGTEDHELHEVLEDQDAVSPLEGAVRALLPAEVLKVVNALATHERDALALRFGFDSGEPRTLAEVGELLGISRERARRRIHRALAHLRHPCFGLAEWAE